MQRSLYADGCGVGRGDGLRERNIRGALRGHARIAMAAVQLVGCREDQVRRGPRRDAIVDGQRRHLNPMMRAEWLWRRAWQEAFIELATASSQWPGERPIGAWSVSCAEQAKAFAVGRSAIGV